MLALGKSRTPSSGTGTGFGDVLRSLLGSDDGGDDLLEGFDTELSGEQGEEGGAMTADPERQKVVKRKGRPSKPRPPTIILGKLEEAEPEGNGLDSEGKLIPHLVWVTGAIVFWDASSKTWFIRPNDEGDDFHEEQEPDGRKHRKIQV